MSGGERGPELRAARHPVRTATLSILAAIGVLAALTVIVISVVRPWDAVTADDALPPLVTSTAPAPEPSTSPVAPEPSGTAGALPIIDSGSARTLLLVRTDIMENVPGAANGIDLADAGTTTQWELADGTVAEPATCGLAVGVTTAGDPVPTVRAWTTSGLRIEQAVRVFSDAATAAAAFASLVGTVDACPTFTWTAPDGIVRTAVTQPATEAQSVFASLYQDMTVTTGETVSVGVRGHVLVSNVIVTWTAIASPTGDSAADGSAIGDGRGLDGIVQDRIAEAVSALR